MKALQSLDYKTNISQTKMIDHVVRDIQILILAPEVQCTNKRLRTTQDLWYKVHLYLCLYKTSLFPHTQKIRHYIFKEERYKAV